MLQVLMSLTPGEGAILLLLVLVLIRQRRA